LYSLKFKNEAIFLDKNISDLYLKNECEKKEEGKEEPSGR